MRQGGSDLLDLDVLSGNRLAIAFKTTNAFNRVEVDPVENTVTWEGGIKLDPEVLYRDLASKAQSALH